MENPENVIFTFNATHSLNIVLNGVLQRGDHVICSVMDHNSVLRPIYSKLEDIECSMICASEDGVIDTEHFASLIKPNTKLVAVTHVSNVCGTVMPIKEIIDICKKNNILFMLDASQSAGILPINICELGIDYLVAPGHKALYGPMGTGILCINSKIIPRPLMFGGTGSNSKELMQPSELPDRFECGTLNLPGICGLNEGINFVKSVGFDHIMKHEMKLTSFLLEGLRENKKITVVGKNSIEGRCGVVSVIHSGTDSVSLAEYLNKNYNIAVRSMYQCAYPSHVTLGTEDSGTLRVSFGLFNTTSQIKVLLYALSHF